MKLTSTLKSSGLYHQGVIYSESGVGKTVCATTAPGPILFWANRKGEGDGGASIAHLDIATMEMSSYYDLYLGLTVLLGDIIPPSKADPEFIHAKLNQEDVTTAAKWVQKIKPKTLVIDAIDSVCASLILGHSREMRGNKGKMNWGDLSEYVPWYLDRILSLPMNVIFLALRDRLVDEDTGATFYRPSMPGKANIHSLLRRMGFFMHLFRGEKAWDQNRDRYLRTQTGDNHICKFRVPTTPDAKGVLPTKIPEIVPADLTALFKMVEQAKGAKK